MSDTSPQATPPANPLGLKGGIDFVQFAATPQDDLSALFETLGFTRLAQNTGRAYFNQNDVHLLLDELGQDAQGFSADFYQAHGPSICAMGWRVEDAAQAFAQAVARGAQPYQPSTGDHSLDMPAIYGIGQSLIYFVERAGSFAQGLAPTGLAPNAGLGFLCIDHLTNNVYQGGLERWASFYKDIFGFSEVRHFDIRGEHTGLLSYALRSPDGSFCIPINEGTEDKSQINEYLREYHGEGVQHLALLSQDLLGALDRLTQHPSQRVQFLDIDDEYYTEVFKRVPGVREDPAHIQRHQVLVDGDQEGYLLQIFTQNVIGPIFFELIQRQNHLSFGEGNFGALFRSIERDQQRRGAL